MIISFIRDWLDQKFKIKCSEPREGKFRGENRHTLTLLNVTADGRPVHIAVSQYHGDLHFEIDTITEEWCFLKGKHVIRAYITDENGKATRVVGTNYMFSDTENLCKVQDNICWSVATTLFETNCCDHINLEQYLKDRSPAKIRKTKTLLTDDYDVIVID